ncbi:hypothetical protein [Nitrosococcus watsonii]|uniref:hypothetical protein n=1 Tax=Nitrosococcus watsonii TaxID=473531 RepID=UPI0002EEAEF9|nr:hypothetical protein [Nitrosococcus watsonii]
MYNLGGIIEGQLYQWPAVSVTNGILICLIAIFIVALIILIANRFRVRAWGLGFVHYTPNLLTSLGIFGTFAGIVIGLLNFTECQGQIYGTLVFQRQQFDQFSTDLWKKLDEFAEMLSKSATEQVINALQEVIADFNQNLTEQFGDNFKALNAAVEKLVQWQENYREQIGQMIGQYAQGVQAITQTEAAVAHISEESKQIPMTMGELRTVLSTTQHQLAELERHLGGFRDMRDRAVEAVPQIREQMDTMVNEVSSAVKGAGEQIVTAS